MSNHCHCQPAILKKYHNKPRIYFILWKRTGLWLRWSRMDGGKKVLMPDALAHPVLKLLICIFVVTLTHDLSLSLSFMSEIFHFSFLRDSSSLNIMYPNFGISWTHLEGGVWWILAIPAAILQRHQRGKPRASSESLAGYSERAGLRKIFHYRSCLLPYSSLV